MDSDRFDALAKRLATAGASRRRLLRGLVGGTLAGAASGGPVGAACPSGVVCSAQCCPNASDICLAGKCTSCPSGVICSARCCDAGEQCVSGRCTSCPSGVICSGACCAAGETCQAGRCAAARTTTTTTTSPAPAPSCPVGSCPAGANTCGAVRPIPCSTNGDCFCFVNTEGTSVCVNFAELRCLPCGSSADCPTGQNCIPLGPDSACGCKPEGVTAACVPCCGG